MTVSRDRREDVGNVDRIPLQLIDMGAVAQHDHPVRIGDDLVELRGDHEQRKSVITQFADQADDLGVGADIDATRRVVEQQLWRRGRERRAARSAVPAPAGGCP